MRNMLREVAAKQGEWAGIPAPIEDEQLIVEPSYPFAAVFNEPPEPEIEPDPELDKLILRNSFWSTHKSCEIFVFNNDGKIVWFLKPGIHHFDYDLTTFGCSFAWGVEQESAAVHLLATLLKPHMFRAYMLTGMFLETSQRSGVTYMFRRLKPTVAMTARKGENMQILCALCMHPIAYYRGSWAGAMCPTDDVVAHLMLMRGDEHMYWKRCSQHPPHRPEAGL